MTKSAVKLVTLLVIFMYWWTPSQSVLNMCRNDTETEAVVHLYRLKRDDDPIGIDCHCTIRPLPGERVGMYFSASYIKGCQYSLTISHKTSTRYLNCNSNLNVIRFYYNIRANDEITLGLTKHVSSATDGFDYSLKIEAARSKVLVRCYAAQSIPTTTRSSSTSTRPTTSAYTSQSRPVLTTILSTTPYRSTPPLSSTALFRSSTRSKTTYLVASQYKSTILTKSQESTTRLGISTLPSTSSRPRYKTSTPHGVNLPPWIETTDGRPTTTQDQYHNQSSTRDSTDNENLVILDNDWRSPGTMYPYHNRRISWLRGWKHCHRSSVCCNYSPYKKEEEDDEEENIR
ncbi:hypothetical protein LOTGIDRAFT_169914 [Lottia gigantea]|uniref:ZP domain-containing protein n=1 Tax=Lottia gigantea TaxID=225164 RepID=V4B2I1_LOTGI|nr:hypothetical protein LOTGIDRAFT_169914 [Lottia gigantea]ESO82594.1 hypothetical protein LOTGIDRAFT_169914 [Lottia gigantea]